MDKNKENIPKIRFPGFEEPWEQCKLGELVTQVIREIDKPNEPYWKMSVRSHAKGTFRQFVDEPQKVAMDKLYVVYEDDLVVNITFAWEHAIAVASNEDTGMLVSHRFPMYRADGKSDIKFLKYLVSQEYFRRKMDLISPGGAGRNRVLSKSEFLKIEVVVPCKIEEQASIGLLFAKLDNFITLHQRKLEHLQDKKKGLLQKMFPKEGEKLPEIRFPGFTDPWEQRKFYEEVEFYSGLTYSPNDVSDNGTFVLRSSNVKNGEVVDADNVYVDTEVVNSSNVKEGDIIVVVRNGSRSLIGKHAQVKKNMDKTVIGAFMTGIRSNQPSFINALMDTQQFSGEVEKNLGATINQITNGMFREMRFMFPDIEEQNQIGNFFNKLDDLITLHHRKLEHLQQQKKGLLQQMFI
jgi:Restriction endonuclease S subunits